MKKDKSQLYLTIGMVGSILLFITVLAIGLRFDPNRLESALINKMTPNIEITDLNSQQNFDLKSMIGKPIILNFWASWCYSCKAEAAELERFHRTYNDKVIVLGIAIQDQAEDAQKFARTYQKTYKLALDTTGKANTEFGIIGVPETFFIKADGTVVKRQIGPVRFAELEAIYNDLLKI